MIWGMAVLLVVGAITAIGLMYSNTAKSDETFTKGPVSVYHPPTTVHQTHDSTAEALRTAARWVGTAVQRTHVGNSWKLTAPALRSGYTLSSWKTGDIPVVPYSFSQARWKLDYSYRDEIGLQVLLLPKRHSGLRPALFLMGLRRLGRPPHRRWLVDYWAPSAASSGAAPRAASGGGAGGVLAGAPQLAPDPGGGEKSRLSRAWLLVPVGVLSLIVLVPLGLGVASWHRGRRASKTYAAELRAMPDLRRFIR